ncbi:MAG TPA: DNA-deoxyinosine glycosylase [candidate division Zixibacteria bacterium]|nr:DNA-deoxyinosine glycosylase [candidate division Zixibacteria bacterium]
MIDRRTRLLILGSLPSDESIRKQEYYGNKQNRFWYLIGTAIGREIHHISYEVKIETLLERGIGLWDIYARGQRQGSADSSIKTSTLNDFTVLKDRCPQLQVVCFNGLKAASQRKTIEEMGYRTLTLLSSSSANAGRDRQRLRQWRSLALFLR